APGRWQAEASKRHRRGVGRRRRGVGRRRRGCGVGRVRRLRGRAGPELPSDGQGAARLPDRAMRTRFSESPFRNPILIGAITILITVVAVYLAYNANSGLPFVPT